MISRKAESPEFPVLLKTDFSHSISYPTINTLIPTNCKVLKREEPIERKTLREVSTTHPSHQRELLILREKSLQSLLIPSPIVIPIKRRFVPKHYPHPFRVLSVFGAWEALEDAKDGGCNMELIARFGKQEKTQLGLTTWQQELGELKYVRQTRFGGSFAIRVLQLYSLVDHFTAWRAVERFFAEFFDFLFDNTCRCYLCVCISLPFTLYLLIAVVFVINYGLEWFTNLGLAYIHHSTHILFGYKLVLVILKLGI